MSIGICTGGHVTGTKTCWCGCKRKMFASGAGKVNVPKHLRPRDANGVNELEKLRIATRVTKGGQVPVRHGIA